MSAYLYLTRCNDHLIMPSGGLSKLYHPQAFSLGRIRFSSTAMMVATTTGDLPKIMVKLSGNWFNAPAAWEMPTPRAADSPTMVVFRAVRSWEAMSFMPVMAMVENTVMVAPPSTH